MRKYKVLHFVLWVVISFFLMGIDYDANAPFLPQLLGNMMAFGLAVPACYFAAFRLTPRYLYQKKIKTFIVYILLLIVGNTIITYLIALYIYHLLTGLPMFRSARYVISIASVVFYYDVMLIAISCAVKIIADRFSMEQRLHEVEKEKINAELNFLRSQVNPHFLFNVMNTIYFQIEKDNSVARGSIEKLSEMLRYQLYECTTDKIDITREIDYLRNYIDMQALRLEKGTDIRLDISTPFRSFNIAPLLLLPLIENAFKHISHYKEAEKNKIHISIKEEGEDLVMLILNTFEGGDTNHLLQSGGLGLPNVRRRLDLIYPGAYELNANSQEHVFTTTLKIKYDD